MRTSKRIRFGAKARLGAVPVCGARRTDKRSAIPGAPELLDASDIDFSLKNETTTAVTSDVWTDNIRKERKIYQSALKFILRPFAGREAI
jgi:hypothetical protein